MRQRLMEREYVGSYAAVWRFVNRLKAGQGADVTVRLETKPGEEAQVDFGYAGMTPALAAQVQVCSTRKVERCVRAGFS